MGNKQRVIDGRAPAKGKGKSQLQDDSIMGVRENACLFRRSFY